MVMAGLYARSWLLVRKGSEGLGPDTHGFEKSIVCLIESVVGLKRMAVGVKWICF